MSPMNTKAVLLGALCVAALAAAASVGDPVFEAKSEFTMDFRRPQRGNDMDFYGADFVEVFNTRLSDWRSERVFNKIFQKYRAAYPNSTVTDKEIAEALSGSELELVRHSRLVTIAVRSKFPELAAALANAYAEAIEELTDEENKKRCDKAVAQIHEQVEKQKRVDDELAARLLAYRMEHRIDNLQSVQAILNQSLQAATADVLEYEKRVTAANEQVEILRSAQRSPESFGQLTAESPQLSEIAAAYTKIQSVKMECARLRSMYTAEHPVLVAKEKEFNAVVAEFGETVKRALAVAQGNLTASRNQLEQFKRRSEELKKRIDTIGQEIVRADAGLKQLEQEKQISSEIYQDLLQKENEHRIVAEQNNEIVRVGRPAQIPTRPVSVWRRWFH